MRSPTIPYIPAIDEVRGITALIIFMHHGLFMMGNSRRFGSHSPSGGMDRLLEGVAQPLNLILHSGYMSVSLFMVLSGFIFASGTWGRGIRYGQFFRARLLRTYPLFLLLCIFAITTQAHTVSLESIFRLVAQFGYLQGGDANPAKQGVFASLYTSMFWSLAVEWQFYLIFPFLMAVLSRHNPWVTLLGWITVLSLLRALAWFAGLYDGLSRTHFMYFTLPGRIDQFLTGIALGIAYAKGVIRPDRIHPAWMVPALILVAAWMWMFPRLGGFYRDNSYLPTTFHLIEGVVFAGVLIAYLGLSPRLPKWLGGALAWVGMISYSLYLLHVCVLSPMAYQGFIFSSSAHWLLDTYMSILLLALPVTLAVAALSFHFIEKPFLELRRPYA